MSPIGFWKGLKQSIADFVETVLWVFRIVFCAVAFNVLFGIFRVTIDAFLTGKVLVDVDLTSPTGFLFAGCSWMVTLRRVAFATSRLEKRVAELESKLEARS
jgi:hypothetical protein